MLTGGKSSILDCTNIGSEKSEIASERGDNFMTKVRNQPKTKLSFNHAVTVVKYKNIPKKSKTKKELQINTESNDSDTIDQNGQKTRLKRAKKTFHNRKRFSSNNVDKKKSGNDWKSAQSEPGNPPSSEDKPKSILKKKSTQSLSFFAMQHSLTLKEDSARELKVDEGS